MLTLFGVIMKCVLCERWECQVVTKGTNTGLVPVESKLSEILRRTKLSRTNNKTQQSFFFNRPTSVGKTLKSKEILI
jgi:hypothetical protein